MGSVIIYVGVKAITLNIEKFVNIIRLNCFIKRSLLYPQGSSIYSDTAAANYGDIKIFDTIKESVPYHRLGTVEEVSIT